MTAASRLDARLAADTHQVARWALSTVLLMDDVNYPWLVLVPDRPGLTEFHDLAPADMTTMTDEIVRASRVLKAVYKPDKINVAALGNIVPQFHVHVIARFAKDRAWPQPVWGYVAPLRYEQDQLDACLAALRAAIAAS